MQSKSLLIAVAAFAVTTTGVHAYGADILERADISEEQKLALLEAKELRASGDLESARDLLVEAGVDEEVLKSIKEAKREAREEIREAVGNGDYDAFVTAIAGGPLADIITTEADFEQFKEAQELRQNGEHAEAREILDELGIEKKGHRKGGKVLSQLTDEQREAVQVAKQANDREAVRAILEEAGVEIPLKRGGE